MPSLSFGTIVTVWVSLRCCSERHSAFFFFPQGKVAKSIVSPAYGIYFHNRQICHHQRRSVFSEGNEITYLSAPKAPHVPEAAGSVLVSAADLQFAALIPPYSKQTATLTSPTQTCTTPTACDCPATCAHGLGLKGTSCLPMAGDCKWPPSFSCPRLQHKAL